MARITVEDCIDKFPSRFELVLVASNRARKLHSGETPTLDKDNDKNTVIALREIAKETLTADELRNDLVEEYQTATFSEDEELNELDEDNVDNANLDNNLIAENNLSEDENRFKRINVSKITLIKEILNKPISKLELLFDNIEKISNLDLSEVNGKTDVILKYVANKKEYVFKLKKNRNVDRDMLNLIKKDGFLTKIN